MQFSCFYVLNEAADQRKNKHSQQNGESVWQEPVVVVQIYRPLAISFSAAGTQVCYIHIYKVFGALHHFAGLQRMHRNYSSGYLMWRFPTRRSMASFSEACVVFCHWMRTKGWLNQNVCRQRLRHTWHVWCSSGIALMRVLKWVLRGKNVLAEHVFQEKHVPMWKFKVSDDSRLTPNKLRMNIRAENPQRGGSSRCRPEGRLPAVTL